MDSKKIDEEAHIPEETLRMIGEMGLFGQQVPPEYGKDYVINKLNMSYESWYKKICTTPQDF